LISNYRGTAKRGVVKKEKATTGRGVGIDRNLEPKETKTWEGPKKNNEEKEKSRKKAVGG